MVLSILSKRSENRMFITEHRHEHEIASLAAQLKDKDTLIAALERRVLEAERSRHEIVEEVRYLIEAAADQCLRCDPHAEHLRTLGHVLPYLLSGKRHWNDSARMVALSTADAVHDAKQLAAEFGFTLPDEPVDAVKAMLDLALVLVNPALSLPLEGLRHRYPIAMESAVRKTTR